MLWWGLGAVTVLLGLHGGVEPSHPPFTGRWGWVRDVAFNATGPSRPRHFSTAASAR